MLKEGQRVRIFLDDVSLKIYNNPIRKYHNTVARIKEVKIPNSKKASRTYTLEGVQSAFGLDYEFLSEWLTPIDVEVTE